MYLLCLMLTRMTRGMPTAIESRKPKSPVVRNDDIDLNDQIRPKEKTQLSATEDEWSTEQPTRALDSDPTTYEVEQTDLFIEPEESVVEDFSELATTEKANKPFDDDDLFINDTIAYNLTSLNVNEAREIGRNVEQITEEPVMEITKHKITDLAELRLPDGSNTFVGGQRLSEHKDIGTAFSLSDDFTDAQLTIDTSPPSNETMVEEVIETLETIDLNDEDDANIRFSSSTQSPSTPDTNSTNSVLFRPIDKSETDEFPTDQLMPSSQTVTIDTKLASDELIDGFDDPEEEVMTTSFIVTEPVENEDDISLTSEIPSTTTTSKPKPVSTYVRSTSPRPNTSPRPTIRRRITDSTTSTTSPDFLFTTKLPISPATTTSTSTITPTTVKHTKFPIITTTSITKLPSTLYPVTSHTPLHVETTVTHPSTPTASPTITTTKKQFLVTVQPLEDDFPEPTYAIDTEDNIDNLTSDENGTLPATTSLDFNGLWNLFSVEATNAIIISGIIGGCAVIFFTTVMVSCMWRQKASRRPAYPPTESSNCSSNSSASSFPASTTKSS
ncbi:hypothetical protein CHUAL_006587 [Chamberlinius hualienensis]